MRAEEHHMPIARPCPDDPHRDRPEDFVSENDLRELGIDPDLIRSVCPWIVEYTGHDGLRCWDVSEIAAFFRRAEL
jgi:hypothetical protein